MKERAEAGSRLRASEGSWGSRPQREKRRKSAAVCRWPGGRDGVTADEALTSVSMTSTRLARWRV